MACDCFKRFKNKRAQVAELQIVTMGFVFTDTDGKDYFVEQYSCVPVTAANVEFVHRLHAGYGT